MAVDRPTSKPKRTSLVCTLVSTLFVIVCFLLLSLWQSHQTSIIPQLAQTFTSDVLPPPLERPNVKASSSVQESQEEIIQQPSERTRTDTAVRGQQDTDSRKIQPAPTHQTSRKGSKLRFDWTDLPPISPVAKAIYNLQHNCSLPVKNYIWRGAAYGLGSDLHVMGDALWAGLIGGFRVQAPAPWIWLDLESCESATSFDCYFPAVRPSCPNETVITSRLISALCRTPHKKNDNFTLPEFRAGATEFYFSSVGSVVVREAERQIDNVFGGKVPASLITLHIRWGDKVMEKSRKNNPILQYINAVQNMVDRNSLKEVHVLVCTEDPVALQAFRDAAKSEWNIYVDHFFTEYQPLRANRTIVYNLPSFITNETRGKPGLWAMGSLLVAMESNYFILETKSNWSRLMNELRKSIVNQRCNNCTDFIDVEEGEC